MRYLPQLRIISVQWRNAGDSVPYEAQKKDEAEGDLRFVLLRYSVSGVVHSLMAYWMALLFTKPDSSQEIASPVMPLV